MSGCEKDDEGRVIDPISFEPIPMGQLITFRQFDNDFCFDIDTLSKIVRSTGRYENPMNRQPLPTNVSRAIDTYNDQRVITAKIYRSGIEQYNIQIYPDTRLGDIIIELYRTLRSLENIGQGSVILDIRGRPAIDPYSYNLDTPIGDIIGDRREITIKYLPFVSEHDRRDHMYDLYQYGMRANLDWLVNLIPDRYKIDPPPVIPYDPLDQSIIVDFLSGVRRKGTSSSTRVSDEYIIRGLGRLLSGAKISAKFAQSLEGILTNRINAGDTTKWTTLLHDIYSKVVDPHNLDRSGGGVQASYYRSRWN